MGVPLTFTETVPAKSEEVLYSSTQLVSVPPAVQLNVAIEPSPGVRAAAILIGLGQLDGAS